MKEIACLLNDRNSSENMFLQEINLLHSFKSVHLCGCNLLDLDADLKKKKQKKNSRENGKRKVMEISFLPFLRVETTGGNLE